MSGVVFAYAAVELVGTAAGETAHPHKIMPRAINSVMARIAVFYVGSLFLLALVLPYTTFKAGESPFVTFFSKIGVEGAGTVMNIVVLTAAFSSLNAGLYSTGRILRSMAMNGSAPKFTGVMSSRGVPYGGIFLTAAVGLFGVVLNLLVPGQAFEIVLNIAALGIIASWATIVICQLQLYRWSKRGILERPSFRLWGTPYTGYITLVFLFGVVVLMAFDPPIGTWTVGTLVVIIPALIIGWYASVGGCWPLREERKASRADSRSSPTGRRHPIRNKDLVTLSLPASRGTVTTRWCGGSPGAVLLDWSQPSSMGAFYDTIISPPWRRRVYRRPDPPRRRRQPHGGAPARLRGVRAPCSGSQQDALHAGVEVVGVQHVYPHLGRVQQLHF